MKIYVITLILTTFFLGGCAKLEVESIRNDTEIGFFSPTPERTNEIFITPEGFDPRVVIIKKGEEVTFINLDQTPHIIASDPHPEHDQLPELFSDPIYQSENYRFVFKKKGEFGFHIEDNPSISGKIVVE